MSYGIWLSYNNQEEGFQIPVNPGSIEMGDGISSTTYDVSGLGEINVIKNSKLTEYSFNSIFPAREYPFVNSVKILKSITVDKVQTNEYVYYITKWMATKRPIRFVFTGDSFSINTPASIESFEWKEVAGSGGDIEYTLKLKKYVFYAAKKVTFLWDSKTGEQVGKITAPQRENDKQPPRTHVLAAGESLWLVAKKYLGDEKLWPQIQTLNNIPSSKLNSLRVGMVLKLPEVNGHD